MKYFFIVLILLLIIAIIFWRLKIKLNKINVYVIKISEADKNIDILLEKKIETLSKIKEKLKDKTDEEIMTNLPKIKNQSLDSFELDAETEVLEKELKDSLDYNKKLVLDDEENALLDTLKKTSIDLKATKNYYNDNCDIYNSIISKFPTLILAKIKGYNQLDFYEIKEEEEFEILKEKN